jgi:hypothetical protein
MKPEEIVRHVLARLDSLCMPYVIVGSFATNVYGVARATKDADLVVQIGPGQLGKLIESLGPELDCDRQLRFESVTGTRKIELSDRETAFTVELFWHSDDAHDQERFARRQKFTLLGRDVWILSREDVLVTKLRWLLIANRPKDRTDIESVIAIQRDAIDWPYVVGWCDRHGTRALLEQIRAELRER